MGEGSEPQTPSPDDVVADFLDTLEPATTVATTNDFRIDINCQKGNHYIRQRKGSGIGRRKDSGNGGDETYRYLGIARIVAEERKGYYEARWQEYQSNHKCHYG